MTSASRTGKSTAAALNGHPQLFAGERIAFRDRHDAGRRLAVKLESLRACGPVVVGVARGGVAVAAEVARALEVPIDVAIVRKIGAPRNPEFALGAVAECGVVALSREAVLALGLSDAALEALLARAERELERRVLRLRGAGEAARPLVPLAGRTAILIDDGLATGLSALAAMRSLRRRGAERVVLAVPVAAPTALAALRAEAEEIVCVHIPEELWAVGYWYDDFAPTSEEEVLAYLDGAI
jgi:putative phosphoribosyl transferase